MENKLGGNSLTRMVVDLKVKGQTFAQIAEKLDTDQMAVIKLWKEYVDTRYTMSFEEQFVLQSERLEALLTTANEIVTMQLDSDAVTALLKVLQEIDSLHNLALSRREKVQLEQVQLTKTQVGILLATVSGIQAYMREQLMEIDSYEKFQELQTNFNQVFTQVSQKALEEVKRDA